MRRKLAAVVVAVVIAPVVLSGCGRSKPAAWVGPAPSAPVVEPAAAPVPIALTITACLYGFLLLFGRWTYEKMYDVWHGRTDNPFTAVFERSQKYVASRTLTGRLPWVKSTLLEGDAADAVARLKQEPGLDLLVMGSGVLADSLMRRGLVDQYQLLIHPLVLGSGRRLFNDGVPSSALRLVNSVPTTTGVIIATYEPADRAATVEV